MPLPVAVAGALIAGGANVIGSGLNAISQSSMNKKTRKWNEAYYKQQRKDALADWNMQNEYNSPAAQMERLKAAGLNPNLVYGNGATTEAGNVRSASGANWSPEAPSYDIGGAAESGISAYMDIRMKDAQMRTMEKSLEVMEQEKLLKAAQTLGTMATTSNTDVQTQLNKVKLEIDKSLIGTSIDAKKAELHQTQLSTEIMARRDEREAALNSSNLREAVERILTMRESRAKSAQEREEIKARIESIKKDVALKELDRKLKSAGIQPGDPMWMRMIQQWLQGGGAGSGRGQSAESALEPTPSQLQRWNRNK